MTAERDPWASQLRKGVLELAVLGLLANAYSPGDQAVVQGAKLRAGQRAARAGGRAQLLTTPVGTLWQGRAP